MFLFHAVFAFYSNKIKQQTVPWELEYSKKPLRLTAAERLKKKKES